MPRLFIYVKYGGVTPITDLAYLPFHRRDDIKTVSVHSEATQSALVAHENDWKLSKTTVTEDRRVMPELIAPQNCTVTDILDRASSSPKAWGGLKRWGLNVLSGRGWGAHQRKTETLHKFEVNCKELLPTERWDRLPLSPMDNVKKGAALLDTGYLWLKRRLALPPMPDGFDAPPQYRGRSRAELDATAERLRDGDDDGSATNGGGGNAGP